MKRIFLLILPLFFLFTSVDAQPPVKVKKTNTKRPGTKRTNKTKVVVAPAVALTDLYIKNEDGSASMEPLYKGDKFVYHVNANGQEYDFIITLNDYSFEKGIDFSYEMTAPANKQGHVYISAKAKETARKYNNYFSGGDMKLTDACTVWMSSDNFMEMPDKKTTMQIDNGAMETFYRNDNDEVNPVINFKGKSVKLDGFILNNATDGKGDKTLWVMGASGNPLILKMDLGWTIELKEIK